MAADASTVSEPLTSDDVQKVVADILAKRLVTGDKLISLKSRVGAFQKSVPKKRSFKKSYRRKSYKSSWKRPSYRRRY